MRYNSILETIHHTPLVYLKSLSNRYNRNIFIKIESANPGGSMKDRVALHCINQAENNHELKPNSTVIESTSGSMGVGLAIICARKGYKLVCVVDPKVTEGNRRLLQFYGAEIVTVDTPDDSGNYLAARLAKVQELLLSIENSYWINQYENPHNPETHYLYTAPEIYEDMEGNIQWIVCPVGTGGLVSGIARYFKEQLPSCRIMAVDACGSVVLKGKPGSRNQVGIGSNRPSQHINFDQIDKCVYVSDAQAFEFAHILAKEESIFMGCSTGSALAGLIKTIELTATMDNIVIIGVDEGLKYLDTVYDLNWVSKASINNER